MKETTFSLEKINIERKEEDLAKDLGSHYPVFKTLYPNRRLTLRDLAEETAKDPGNLSRLITRWEGVGVVETAEVERGSGRPYRYIKLSERVVPVISSIIMAIEPITEEFDPSILDIYLDTIEDSKLDEEIRKPYANALQARFTARPQIMLLEHERLRKTLEALGADPTKVGEVENIKRTLLRISIPRLVGDERTRSWVMEKVYPKAINLLEEKKPEKKTLLWAISVLENIATNTPKLKITADIRCRLREVYFDEKIKQESSVGEELANAILRLSTKETKTARELINYLKGTLKEGGKEGEKKAALLLKNIVGYLHM